MNSKLFQIVRSGDGFEIVASEGKVIAWTMELTWAALIIRGLEREILDLKGGEKAASFDDEK